MTLAVKKLASKYSKQYLDRLRNLLLEKSYAGALENNSGPIDFELDLEVVYDQRKKVEDVVIK